MHHSSNTTLFADDTLLMLADKNLDMLETKVNEQIQHVDYWLRKNKLSLNYSKTNFLLIQKQIFLLKKKFFIDKQTPSEKGG